MSSRTLLVGSLLLWSSVLPVQSVSSDWEFYCGNETFPSNGPYEKRLNSIAERLPSQVSAAPSYFLAVSSASKPEQVYAAGQCRQDSSPTDCMTCIHHAFQGVGVRCHLKKVAAIVYNMCSLWISHEDFVDLNFNTISFLRFNKSREPVESEVLGKIVAGLVFEVAAETAKSLPHFATAEQQIIGTNGSTLYAFAQCVPTVTRSDCRICLNTLISKNIFLPTSLGGESSSLWCQFRWELYPFITEMTPTLEEGKHGSSSEHQWKRKFIILSVVAGSAVLSMLIVSAVVLSIQWRNKRLLQQHSSGKRLELMETITSSEKETGEGSSSKVELQPSALDSFEEIVQMAKKKKEIAVFLDYDGTLAPIVNDPKRAYMSNEMRGVLQNVANLFRTSIVTGRDIETAFDFIRIKNISYAGNHGKDIKIVTWTTQSSEIVEEHSYQPAKEYVGTINEVHQILVNATREINGTYIERKNYDVSLHYRNVAEEDMPHVNRIIDEILENMKDQVKHMECKMVHEFGPPIKWNKGDAVLYIAEKFRDPFPIYIGDDKTDEDAFKVLREKNDGIGILVAETGRETTAFYSLKNTAQVMEFLKMLVKWKQDTQE